MSSASVHYRLIGEVSLRVNGVAFSLAGRRQRELVALLLLESDAELSPERIAYELWGDSQPKTARNSVQRFVADVRAKLGTHASRLSTGAVGYRLDFDRSECDLLQSEDLISSAHAAAGSGRFEDAAELFRQVADLQRGIPLAGLGDIEFAERIRRHTAELWLGAAETHFEVELALGHHLEVLPEIAAFTAENPYRERAWEHHLVALYRCGRQQDALSTFAAMRTMLRTELRVSPSPALNALEQRMLDHAPELQAPAHVPLTVLHRPNDARSDEPAVPHFLQRASEISLAGRQPEINAIDHALQAALAGNAQTIVMRGEPGIGKTRLAAAAAMQAAAAGFTVVYGRSDEAISTTYQPWVEVLGSLATSLSGALLREHYDRFGTLLTPLVSNLPHLISTATGVSALPTESLSERAASPAAAEDQMVLFQAALGLIQTATGDGPVVIILDDLQWADPSTLRLLDHVVQRAGGQLAIILVYRSTVLAESPLIELVGRLSPLPSVTEIDLDGLRVGELTQVIENLGGGANNESLAQTVHEQTNGNAFFATEVIRHLITTEPAAIDSQAGVPASANRIIQRRVARLGEHVAATLQAASVFGRDFELDLLTAVVGHDEFVVLERVERALSDGLLVDSDEGYDRFRFVHDLVYQSLYNDLSSSRRSRLHLKVADTIEELRPRDRAARAGEIARHLLAVGDQRMAMRNCLAARDAGQVAAASYAPGEAVQWFTRSLEQLDLTADEPSLRARLLVQLGINQQYSQAHGHRETLLQAGSIASRAGDIDTLVDACLANTRGTFANVWNVDQDLVALLLQALEAISDSEIASRSSLLAALASEQWDLDHDVVIERHMTSIDLARESGRPEVLAGALLRYARARGCYLSPEDHRAMNVEISALFDERKVSAPTMLITLQQSKLQVAFQSAEAHAVRREIAQIRSLPERLPLPYVENYVVALDTVEAGITGDTERYEALAGIQLEQDLASGDPEAFLVYEAHLLYTRLMQGRTAELIGEIERIVAERPDAELYQSVAALLHIEAGDVASSAALLTKAHTRGFVNGSNVFEVQSLGFWGEVAAGVGNIAVAQVLFELLEPFSGQFLGNMTQLTQPVDLTLGRLCTALGRFDDAARFLASSAATAEQFDASWMTARTALYQGVLAAAQGASADVVERYANQALAIATDGDYRAIVRDAKALVEANA